MLQHIDVYPFNGLSQSLCAMQWNRAWQKLFTAERIKLNSLFNAMQQYIYYVYYIWYVHNGIVFVYNVMQRIVYILFCLFSAQ